MGNPRFFSRIDLVRDPLPNGRAGGWGAPENDGEHWWRWVYGPKASLQISDVPLHGLKLRLQLRLPFAGIRVEAYWNGHRLGELARERGALELLLMPANANEGTLELRTLGWSPGLAPGDQRPLSFLVEQGEVAPAFDTVGRLCPYPFSRMELPNAPFVPCCRSWLREEYFSLEAGEDPWNGPAAQALRATMHDGSYRYCRLDRCGTALQPAADIDGDEAAGLPISPANREAARAGATVLPEGPAGATLMGDPRCNLACSSCREEKVTKLAPTDEPRVREMARLLDLYAPGLRTLKVAGDGEALFSPALREAIRTAAGLPRLEGVELLSNGLLLDESAFAELAPGSERVRSVSVSVDAGDEATYRRVRGGDWARLCANLEWVSGERRRGRFRFFGLNFVLRRENFRSLPAFLQLADRLGCDEVFVSQLYPWERMRLDFSTEAVHLPGHPEHAEFVQLWEVQKERPRAYRWRSNLP